MVAQAMQVICFPTRWGAMQLQIQVTKTTNMTEEGASPATLKEIDEAITECSELKVKFGFLKLGSLCDASKSRAFSSARCDIEIMSKNQSNHYSMDFNLLFNRGFKLFNDYKDKNLDLKDATKYAPINTLAEFWEKIGKS